jgi:hypothetical protein
MKGFVLGFICASVLTGGVFAASSIMAELYPNNVTIWSNWQKVKEDNFTYGNKTYAPVRELAEKADCTVEYDEKSKIVDVVNRFQFNVIENIKVNGIAVNHNTVVFFGDDNSNTAYFDFEVLGHLGIYSDYDSETKTMSLTNPYMSETATKSQTPSLDTPDVVESRVEGTFNGWDGDTILQLSNGQIWKQSDYTYGYTYKYSPKILIYKSGTRYKAKIDGYDREAYVTRLK